MSRKERKIQGLREHAGGAGEECTEALDREEALELLDKYRVEYIYVGELERHYYLQQGLEKFDRMLGTDLELVYVNPGVQIYRVLPDSLRF